MKIKTMMICKMERTMCMCEIMDRCFVAQMNRVAWPGASV